MNDVFYHIGLHKTATTYLQNEYFIQLPINYVRGSEPYISAIKLLAKSSIPTVISEENFSGKLFCGAKYDDFLECINSIKAMHPKAKILIGFRKHKDFLLSAYKQHLHESGCKDFSEFYNGRGNCIIKDIDISYTKIIKDLQSNFDSIYIYTIDDVRNIKDFHRNISNFMGIECVEITNWTTEVNKSISSELQVRTLKILNLVDKWCCKAFGFKVFSSKLFKLLKINSRKLCQYYLPAFGKKYTLSKLEVRTINEKFQDDWQFVLESKGTWEK